jgi:hypothetical protein
MTTNQEKQQDCSAAILQEVDRALADEPLPFAVRETAQSSSPEPESEHHEDSVSRIGSFLRFVGAAILIIAASIFLVRQWDGLEHIGRYFSFLGFTVVVCAAGLFCGIGIRENKGARTLLGIVLLVIPVHFSQLGALLYSQFGSNFPSYPEALRWDAHTPLGGLLTMIGGLLVLAPMAFLAFSVMSRTLAPNLLLTSFLVSSALLVPSRDPMLIGALLAGMTSVVLNFERNIRHLPETRTFESIVARLVAPIAIAILLGRQVLYGWEDELLIASVLGVVSAILLRPVPRLFGEGFLAALSELLSIALVPVAYGFAYHGIHLHTFVPNELLPAAYAVPVVTTLIFMSRFARNIPEAFRTTAGIFLVIASLIECLPHLGGTAYLTSLALGIVAVGWACISEQKAMLFSGIVIVLASLGRITYVALQATNLSWLLILGVIGLVTIVAASYLERNFTTIQTFFSNTRERLKEWN